MYLFNQQRGHVNTTHLLPCWQRQLGINHVRERCTTTFYRSATCAYGHACFPKNNEELFITVE